MEWKNASFVSGECSSGGNSNERRMSDDFGNIRHLVSGQSSMAVRKCIGPYSVHAIEREDFLGRIESGSGMAGVFWDSFEDEGGKLMVER